MKTIFKQILNSCPSEMFIPEQCRHHRFLVAHSSRRLISPSLISAISLLVKLWISCFFHCPIRTSRPISSTSISSAFLKIHEKWELLLLEMHSASWTEKNHHKSIEIHSWKMTENIVRVQCTNGVWKPSDYWHVSRWMTWSGHKSNVPRKTLFTTILTTLTCVTQFELLPVKVFTKISDAQLREKMYLQWTFVKY